ncbi:28462_t:CDS:2, partial [Gigaspora margarita]
PTVILTNFDPAVNAIVEEIFLTIYLIHCAFYISQNIYKNLHKQLGDQYKEFLNDFYNYIQEGNYLKVLYRPKEYWAHSYTAFKFTGRMISTSRVEAINACLKRLLYNSNTSLCELMSEIHRLLD